MMTLKHGTLHRYNQGCRCLECVDRNAEYRQQRRDKLAGEDVPAGQGPGPVELAVCEEIAGAVGARPGVAAVAVCLARLLDNPQARNQAPAAAKVLAGLLDKLVSDSARQRRGGLALVRTMTDTGGA
jgi:hypothetical protein